MWIKEYYKLSDEAILAEAKRWGQRGPLSTSTSYARISSHPGKENFLLEHDGF